jgi:hypothetical protein
MDGFFVPAGFKPMTLTSRSALIAHSVTNCPTPRGLYYGLIMDYANVIKV